MKNLYRKLTREEKKNFKRYSKNAENPFVNYYLREGEGGGYYLVETLKIWFYILMFIPIHVFEFVHCLWDGGLKSFTITGRIIYTDYLAWGSLKWKASNKILKLYDENEN